ncbi:hypothetical protein JCM10213_004826, partial [Rhodosporidiobolus nylandii]
LLKAAGSFTGHSLRSGGATWLAEQGVDFDTIRRCGRWRSSAFEIYIRRHPAALAAFQVEAAKRRDARAAREAAAAPRARRP